MRALASSIVDCAPQDHLVLACRRRSIAFVVPGEPLSFRVMRGVLPSENGVTPTLFPLQESRFGPIIGVDNGGVVLPLRA